MGLDGYHIAAVARSTGVSADTIRSWERRYGLVAPQRDAAGVRFYSEAEVARLKLVRQATLLGHPIRTVAKLGDEALAELVAVEAAPACADGSSDDAIVAALLDAVQAGDATRLKRTIRSAVMLVEPEELVLGIFVPLMHEIGRRWHAGRLEIWQEHLLSEIVSSASGVFARVAETASSDGGFVFATPPGERHVFGIAFAAMLASSRGFQAYNLGTSVPAPQLAAAVKRLDAQCAVVGITRSGNDGSVAAYLEDLDRALPRGVEVWVGGNASARAVAQAGVARARAVPTLEAFANALQR